MALGYQVLDKPMLAKVGDRLLVAVAVSLPWSTSVTSILLVFWLIVLIPTLNWLSVRRELLTAPGGLPVLLVIFAVAGMSWADVSLVERWNGLDGFLKLLVFPLLITQARRSDISIRVFFGFLAACIVLLIASWAVTLWPQLPRGSGDPGVAVKSYIAQSAEFTICGVALAYGAFQYGNLRPRQTLALLALSCAFIGDIIFIATSRTALVVIPLLVMIFAIRFRGLKAAAVTAFGLILLIGLIWPISSHLRGRVDEIFTAIERHSVLGPATPSEERLVFWDKSIHFIEVAPLLGHGTGSITEMFRRSAIGQNGMSGEVSSNPHNQTFAVGIQLGLVGVVLLWMMWLSHLTLFRGEGLAVWIGLALVVQNIVSSLFNSFLFDFTEGWLYVVGVAVAGGTVLRLRDESQAKAE
jgi:O-antigen ligase